MPDLERIVFLTPPPVPQEQLTARLRRVTEMPGDVRVHYLTDDTAAGDTDTVPAQR